MIEKFVVTVKQKIKYEEVLVAEFTDREEMLLFVQTIANRCDNIEDLRIDVVLKDETAKEVD